ncbi:MAG: type II secretion system protein [Nitrospirae bacterium]|nr:type II secretion system protein [Nitrospirota bacterium]
MKNGNGFTLIEVLVVLTIVGILTGLLVYQFAGQTTKSNVELTIKQLYADLSEIRMRAMSDKLYAGLYWNNISLVGNYNITSYEMRTDAANGATIANGSIRDAGMGLCTGTNGCTLVKPTVTPVTVAPAAALYTLYWIDNVTFDDKGMLALDPNPPSPLFVAPIEIYAKCFGCDTSSSCSDSNLSACRPADTSPNCNDTSYPEYSCLVVNTTFIKMGKWCDANQNGVYNIGECSLR